MKSSYGIGHAIGRVIGFIIGGVVRLFINGIKAVIGLFKK